jgi:hypothetical protein
MVNNNNTITVKDSVKRTVNNATITDFVQAEFTTHEQILLSHGVLDMKVIDAQTNRVLMQEKFGSDFRWQQSWGSVQGDTRALNSEQNRLLKERPIQPPPPQDLFAGVCEPLFARVTSRLRQFYRTY